MTSTTRIGITGATGMIGTNLITLITEEQALRIRYRPVALVRDESNAVALRDRGVETRTVDFRDPGSFAGKLEDLDVLVHLGGLTKAYRRADFYEVNAGGTRHLLQCVARCGRNIRHLLFSSSVAASGPSTSPDKPKDEKAPCSPRSHYGASKLEAERLIAESGLPFTVLRLPMVLGPHDYEGLRLFRLVRSGWVWTFGKQEDYFSYVCAQDLSRVLMRMVLNGSVMGEIINVSYDGSVRGLDFYGRIREILGLDPVLRLRHLPRWTAFAAGLAADLLNAIRGKASYISLDKARDLTSKYLVTTNRKLKQRLGMERFEERGALAQTVRWFTERGLL